MSREETKCRHALSLYNTPHNSPAYEHMNITHRQTVEYLACYCIDNSGQMDETAEFAGSLVSLAVEMLTL